MKQSKLFGLRSVLPVRMLSTSAHAFSIDGTSPSESGGFVLTVTQPQFKM